MLFYQWIWLKKYCDFNLFTTTRLSVLGAELQNGALDSAKIWSQTWRMHYHIPTTCYCISLTTVLTASQSNELWKLIPLKWLKFVLYCNKYSNILIKLLKYVIFNIFEHQYWINIMCFNVFFEKQLTKHM